MRTNTIKSLAAIVLTGVGSAFVVGFRTQDVPILASSRTATTSSTTATGTTGTSPTTSSPSPAGGSTATAPPPAASAAPSAPSTSVAAATYADGTWTGQAVREPWGTFQVEAVVSGGRVTDVVLVAAPQDGHSNRINNRAVPALTQAAVAAQSAQIDMISGATWTSESYITSLQAALDEARAAVVAAS